MSSCQNISPVGLSSLTCGAGDHLQELTLSFVSPVSLSRIKSLYVLLVDCFSKV